MATKSKKKKSKSADREIESVFDTKSKNKSKSEDRETEVALDVSWHLRAELKRLTKDLDKISSADTEDEEKLSKTIEDMKRMLRCHKIHFKAGDTILLRSLSNTKERITDIHSRARQESKALNFINEISSDLEKEILELNEIHYIEKIKSTPHQVNVDLKIKTCAIETYSKLYFNSPGDNIWVSCQKEIQEAKDKMVKILGRIQSLHLPKDDIDKFELEQRLEELKNYKNSHSKAPTACDRMPFLEECLSEIENEILNVFNPQHEANDASLALEEASPSIQPELEISLEERLRRAHIGCDEFDPECVVNEVHTTFQNAYESAMKHTFENPHHQGKEWFSSDGSTISCKIEKDGIKCETKLKIQYYKEGNKYVFKLFGINDHSLHQENPSIGDLLDVDRREEAPIRNQSTNQDEPQQELHPENHANAEQPNTNQQSPGQENHPEAQNATLIQCQRGIQIIIDSFENEQERLEIMERFKLQDLQSCLEKKFLAKAGKLFTLIILNNCYLLHGKCLKHKIIFS